SGNFGLGTYQALQYIPSTDTWNVMAAQAKRRAYHSTAVLMPDGTVLSGGDNGGGVGGGAALETYSPPYMFSTARPKITSAPTTATRGTTMAVNTNVAVKTLELIAPGAATHATDLEQRLVQLTATATTATSYVATLPADNTLPPGPYMLFAVDAHGVPSVATWVMVS
ncbi:MAG TPA: galactose oxidase early set domain-containing protein, partial [Acidimicrobiia bacterium]